MAITTYRQSAAPGWASTSVIYQLEAAFAQLGWHGGTVSGIVTGITGYSGQSVVGSSSTDFYDCRPKSGGTSIGVGDTCSFSIFRSSGSVNAVYVNRGGHGYSNGDNLVIDGVTFGGGNDMTVVVQTDSTSYGSASTFYDKDVTNGSSAPWGVLRVENDNTKVYGDTYFGFQANNNNLYFYSGTSFYPYDTDALLNKQGRYANTFRGQQYQDLLFTPEGTANRLQNSGTNSNIDLTYFAYGSSNSYTLELNIFRSGIDSDFAIFSFKHPDKPASSLMDNTYGTFFLHKFSHSLLNLDEMFSGDLTYFNPSFRDMTNAHHEMHTTVGNSVSQQYWVGRHFMMGWATGSYTGNINPYLIDRINSSSFPRQIPSDERRHYYRTNNYDSHPIKGNLGLTDYTNKTPDVLNHNAVYKGIPLSSQIIPCPFYLPDDFVLIEFDNPAPGANIQQYDTITISEGSEVYSVIDGSYNQTTRSRGILLCARTT